jgi:hypothetical protein
MFGRKKRGSAGAAEKFTRKNRPRELSKHVLTGIHTAALQCPFWGGEHLRCKNTTFRGKKEEGRRKKTGILRKTERFRLSRRFLLPPDSLEWINNYPKKIVLIREDKFI